MTDQPEPEDTCRPVDIDGETIRVRGAAEMSDEAREALGEVIRAAKAKLTADAPEMVGALQNRLRLAHQARRAKEHQLDDIRRALCDIGFMQDDDPYSHADLADAIRQTERATAADATLARIRAYLNSPDGPCCEQVQRTLRGIIDGPTEQPSRRTPNNPATSTEPS